MRIGAAFGVIGRALTLLVRHWPTLLVLWLLGWLGSRWATRLAVAAYEVRNWLGLVVLCLAPVATLAAVVVSLRVMRTSSPGWVPPVDNGQPRGTRMVNALDSTASVLIPFLAVYVSQGALRELTSDYTLRVVDAERQNVSFDGTFSVGAPVLPESGWVIGIIAGLAFGLRWLIRRRGGRRAGIAVPAAWIGAWIEAVWLLMLALLINARRRSFWNWVQERRVVRALGDLGSDIADATGGLNEPLRDVWAAGQRSLGALDRTLLAPLALLTIGAVVYGVTIGGPEAGGALPGEETMRRRLVASRMTRRLQGRVPAPFRGSAGRLTRPLRGRIAPLVHGLRLVARSGLAAMMFFAVAYAGCRIGADWLHIGTRRLIGPHPIRDWIAIDSVLSVAFDAVGGVAAVVLLAAAIERLVAGTATIAPASPVVDEQVDDIVGADVADANGVDDRVARQQEDPAGLER